MSPTEKLKNGVSVTPTQAPLVTYPLSLQICSASHSSWWKTDVIVLVLDISQGYSKNILMMMCYQKTPQMGIRQLLCCVKQDELWTISCLLNNSYWCLHTGGEEWNFHLLIFFLSIFQQFNWYPQPSGLEGYCRHGPGGRAGGCQTCRPHISVTGGRIFSTWSFVELSRPLVVHCHGHLHICPIWACPWAKNLSNLPQIESKLCRSHISKTAGWMYAI